VVRILGRKIIAAINHKWKQSHCVIGSKSALERSVLDDFFRAMLCRTFNGEPVGAQFIAPSLADLLILADNRGRDESRPYIGRRHCRAASLLARADASAHGKRSARADPDLCLRGAQMVKHEVLSAQRFEQLWADHLKDEFESKDVEATLSTTCL
jgi:hypothetical protein